MLIKEPKDSKVAAVLVNAIDKFETLTENDEYLFDETKDTKQEVLEIKNLLKSANQGELFSLLDNELSADSLFVYTALEFTENEEKVRSLLSCENPTVVLKALEMLKQMGVVTKEDKQIAYDSVDDENVKNVIMAI
jgi:hypothetical protein